MGEILWARSVLLALAKVTSISVLRTLQLGQKVITTNIYSLLLINPSFLRIVLRRLRIVILQTSKIDTSSSILVGILVAMAILSQHYGRPRTIR